MGCVSTPPVKHDEQANPGGGQNLSKPIMDKRNTLPRNDKAPAHSKNKKITYRLLLLGAGESGKTTLLKQMRKIHGPKYEQYELMALKPHLILNLIEGMRALCVYSEILADQGEDTKVNPENQEIRERVAQMKLHQIGQSLKRYNQIYNDLSALWSDPHIKNTMQFKDQFQLIDSAEYLFERMESFLTPDYCPTFEDILRCRQRTAGLNKLKFTLNQSGVTECFEIKDVGGQKNERKKWDKYLKLDHADAVIFVAALSGYNQFLWEDGKINRMKESIGLFRTVAGIGLFKSSQFIFFLNKSDLFDAKFEENPIKCFFPDYKGDNSKNSVINFIKQQFVHCLNKEMKATVKFHVTCATDTKCVERMFESVRSIIINKNFDDMGMGIL